MDTPTRKENRKFEVKFDGNAINIAATLLDKLTSTIEIIYYLMERGEERSFVVMLISAQDIEMKKLLMDQKRDTDILFEIDTDASVYAVVCQDTKIDGGYHFANRVLHDMKLLEGKEIYCTELEVRTTDHPAKHVVFKLVETYIKAKEEKQEGEIIFKTLY